MALGVQSLGVAQGLVSIDTAAAQQSMNNLANNVDGVKKNISNSMQAVGQSMTRVGTMMSLGVTAPIVAMGAKAIDSFAKFQRALALAGNATGATAVQMEALRQKAFQLGKDTAFSAGEAAQGIFELGKSGFDADQALSGIEGTLMLAAAAQIEVAEAAGVSSNMVAAFGLEAADLGKVVDSMTGAVNNSPQGFSELNHAMNTSAGTFGSYGLSIDDLTTSLAVMANTGLMGQRAGTGINRMLMELSNPRNDAAAAMIDELGISIWDASGNMVDMETIVGQLNGGLEGMTTEQKNLALATIFGNDALHAANRMAAITADEFGEMYTQVTRAGQAAELSETIMGGLAGAFDYFRGTLDTMLIQGISPFGDAMANMVRWVADLIAKFGDMSSNAKKWIAVLLGVAAAIGPILMGLGPLLTFISTLGFLISPVTLVIGAIVLLGFYLGKLFGWWDSFDDLKSKVVGFFNNVDPIESFSRAVEKVSNGVKGFIELWKNEDYEKGFFQGLSTSIADVGSAIGDELIYRFALLGNVITENIPFVNTLRESVWDFRKVMTQRQDLPFFERLMTATRAAGLVIKTGLVDEFIKFETRMTEAVPGSQVLFDTIWRFQKTMDTSDLPFFEKLNLAISEAGESINSELIYRFALLGNALTENIPLAKTLWDAYNVFGRAMNVNKELPYFERLKASIQETSTMLWVEFSNSKLVGDIVYPFAILGNAITENIPFVNTLRESVFKFRQVMTQQQDLTFFERLGVAAYEASLIIGDELIYRFALLGNALTENIPLAKTLWDAYNVFGRAMNVNKELPYFERLKASIQETSTMLWVEFSNSKLVGDIVYPFAILGNAITENIPFVNTLRESVFKFRQVMTQQQDLTFFERLGVAAYEASLIIGDELIYRFALLGNALTENIPLAKTLWDAYNVFGRAMNVNKELPYFERLKASIQETSTMLWVEFSNSKLVGDIVYPFAILGNAITENIPFVNTLRESVFKFRQVMTQQQDLPLFERLGVAAHEASLIIGDELIYRLALLGNVITENIPFVNTLRESVFKFRQVMTQQQDLPFFERLGVAAHEASLIIGDELIYRLALFGNVLTENIPLAKTLWDAYNVFGRAMNVNKELPYFERLKASIQETSTMLWVEFSNSKLVGDIVYPFAILGNVITENIPLIQSAREAMQNFSRTMTMDQELPFWDRLKKAITESSHMFWVEWINSDFVGDIVYPFAILGNAITENIPFVNTLRESVFKFRQVMTQKQDLPFFERLGVAAHEASLIIGDELIHRLALLGNVITENIPFVNTLRESVFKFRQVMTQNKDLPFFKRLKLAVKESTNIIGKYIQKFFKNVFKKLKIKDALKDLRAKFLKLFDVGSFTELWEKFSTSWNEGWESIFQESDAIRDDIKYWFSETWENAVETVTEFWNTFSVAWKKGWEKIFSGEANFIKDIKSWFANAWDQSVETVTEFWNTFSVAWKKGWEKILEDSEDIKEDIKSWFANAWDQSVETVTEFWNTFSVAWKEGWSKVEDKVEDFFDDFSVAWKEGWSKAFKKLEDFISDIGDVDWGGVLDNVSDTASDWGSVIRQWISNAWYWVRDNVLDWGSVLTQTLKNVWTWITGIAKEWGTKFRDWITESWTWLKDNASTKSKEWGDLLVLVIEVAWNNITEIGKNWGKHIRRWISSAWTWVKDNPLGAEWGLTLDTILENAWTNISKIYESWGENIRGWISSAWTWVKDNPLGAEWGLTLDTILENAWTNISDIYESWGENIRGWISSAWTWVKDNPLQTEWGKLLIASLAYAFVGGSALAGTWGSIISGWLNQAWIDAGESISGWSFEDSFEWPTIPKFELGWDVREVLTEVQTTITNAWKEFRETLAYIFGAPMEVITDPDQVNAEWDQLVSDSHKFLEDSEAGFSHIDKFMWPTIPEFTLGWDVSKVLSGVGDTITNAWSSFRSSVSHIFGKGSRDVEQESEANLKTRSGIGDPRSDFEQYWTEDDLKRIRQSEELMAEVAASKERTDAILKGVVDDFKTGMDLGAIQGEKNAEEFIESIESFEWPTIPEFTLGWDIGAVLTEVQTTISAAWNGFIVDIKSLLGIDGEGNSAVTDIFKWPTIPEFELGWDVSGVLTAVGDTITNAWSAFRGSLSHIFGSGMKEVEKETKLLSELPEPSMYEKRIDFGDPRHVVEPFWTEKDLKGLEAAAANREGFMKALGGREFMPEDEADANNKALLENHRKYIAETEAAMSAQQESFEWPDIPKFEISWNLTETFDSARETITGAWNAFVEGIKAAIGITAYSVTSIFMWPEIPKFELGWDVSEVLTGVGDTISTAWSSFRSSVSHIFGKGSRDVEQESEENLKTRSSVGDPRSDFEQYWTEDDLKRIRQSEELMAEVAASKERTDAILKGVVDDFKTGMDLGAIQGEKNAEEFIESIESFEWPTIPEFTLGWDIGAVLTEVQTKISTAWNGFIVDIKSLLGIDGEGNSAVTDIFKWPTIPEFTLGWDVSEVLTEVQTTITNAWKAFRGSLSHIFGSGVKEVEKETKLLSELPEPSMYEKRIDFGDPRHVVEPFWTEKDLKGLEAAAANREGFMKALGGREFMPEDEADANNKALLENHRKYIAETEAAMSAQQESFEWPDIPKFEISWNLTETFDSAVETITGAWNAFVAGIKAAIGITAYSVTSIFMWPEITEFTLGWDVSEVFTEVQTTITNAWKEFRETLAYIFGAPMEVITDPDQVNAEWDQLVSDSHKFLEDSEAGFSHIDKFMWPTIPEFTLGWDVSKVLSGVGDTISTAWSSFRSSVSHIFGKERREIEKESEANLNTRSSIGDPRSDFEQYWTEDDLKRIRQSEELMAEVAASKERTDAILQGVVDDFKTGMDLGAIQGEKNAEEFIESIESFEWPTIPDFTLGWDIGARLTEVQTTISAAWNGFIVDIKSLLGIDGEGNSAITDIFEWPTIPEFELGWDVNEVFTEVQTTITNAWKEFRETLAYIFGAPMEVITDPDQVNAEWDQLVSDSHKFLEDSEAGFSHIDKFMWPTIPEFELDWDISTVLTGIGTVISESWNAFTASVGSLFGSEDGGEKKNAFEWPKIPEFAEDFDASDVGKTIVDSITAAWEWAGKNVGDWGAILMSILSSAWTGLVDISSLWGSMLRLWLTSVWDWVKSNPTEGWGQKILEILSAAWDKVLDIKSVWGPKILTWLDETWTWIKDSYPDWSETVITILENAWNAITGVAEKWGPIIGKWLSESWDWVRKNKPVKDEMSKYMEDFEIPQFEMEDPKAAEIINQDKLLTSMDKISELFGNSWINILSKNLFPKMNVVFGNAIILAAEYASDEAYENQTFINAIGRIAGFAIGHLTAAFIALPFELISKAANALLTGFGAIVQFALGIKIEDDRPQIEKISENFVDVFWTAIIDAWTARWEKFKEEMLDSLYYLEEILALFEGGELSEPSFDEIQEKKSQKRLDKEYLDLAEGTPEPKRRGFWHYGVEPFRNAMSQIGEAQTIQTQTNAFWYENWIINLGIFSQGVDLQWEQFLLNEETGFSALGASQLEREEANTLFWDNWILGLQAWNNGTALEWQINAEEQKAWMDKQAAKWSQFKLDMGLRWKATAEKFKDKFLIPMGTRMQKFVIDTELFGIDSLSKWYLFVHDPWKLAMNAFGALWEDMGEKIDGVIDSIETNVKRVKDAIDEIKKFSISDLNPFKNRNKNKDTTDYADRIRTDIATSRYTKNLRMWDAASQKNISLEDYYEKYGNSAGTSYWGGGVTMVGESGPELVTLPRGSRIDNAGQTNQMVNRKDDGMGEGGKTVNQTFNIMVEQDESGVRDWEDFAAFQAAI